MQRLLSELQRRKVLRVAAAYLVAAWIVLQVALALQTAMSLAASFSALILWLLVAGFFVATALAWFFDITPQGIKRTVDTAGTAGTADGASIKFQTTDLILVGVLGLVIAVGVAQALLGRNEGTGVATTKREEAATTTLEDVALAPNSIAVLPFANNSPDEQNKADPGYGDFLAELVASLLGKAETLSVKSQTSASAFRGREIPLPEIARQLRARLIVEGRVRRDGGKIVVSAQLIEAASDTQLWRDIYERSSDDTLYVQREIAAAIAVSVAAKLNATISAEEQRALTSTKNLEALKAFDDAVTLYRMSGEENLRRALQRLDQAVDLAPDFAVAWALLSRIHSYLYFNRTDATEVRRLAAKAALDNALRLEPELTDGLLARAYYQYWVERDFTEAKVAFEELHRKWPSNADAVAALASIARREGRWTESRAYFDKALDLDPLHISRRFAAAETMFAMRDFSAALKLLHSSLERWKSAPDNLPFVTKAALIYQALGDLPNAEALLKDVQPRPGDDVVEPIVYQAMLRREPKAAIALLEGLLKRYQAEGSPGRAALDLNIYLGNLRRLSGDRAGAKANYRAALKELEADASKQGKSADVYSYLALVHCGLGNRKDAFKFAALAVAAKPVAKDAWSGAYYEEVQARVRARLGDRKFTIPAIERLLKLQAPLPFTRALLRLDPDFDTLRADARFAALLDEP